MYQLEATSRTTSISAGPQECLLKAELRILAVKNWYSLFTDQGVRTYKVVHAMETIV